MPFSFLDWQFFQSHFSHFGLFSRFPLCTRREPLRDPVHQYPSVPPSILWLLFSQLPPRPEIPLFRPSSTTLLLVSGTHTPSPPTLSPTTTHRRFGTAKNRATDIECLNSHLASSTFRAPSQYFCLAPTRRATQPPSRTRVESRKKIALARSTECASGAGHHPQPNYRNGHTSDRCCDVVSRGPVGLTPPAFCGNGRSSAANDGQ
ncbi:hypothetical protein V8F33_004003 [Rhypophila sp. PSN 637]